jgi:hypothetical protein
MTGSSARTTRIVRTAVSPPALGRDPLRMVKRQIRRVRRLLADVLAGADVAFA